MTDREDNPTVEFSVVVRDDGKVQFDSKVTAPLLGRTDQQIKDVANAWMDLMTAGLRVSAALRDGEPA